MTQLFLIVVHVVGQNQNQMAEGMALPSYCPILPTSLKRAALFCPLSIHTRVSHLQPLIGLDCLKASFASSLCRVFE